MINASTAYKQAVTGTTRRTALRIVANISSPDLVFTGVSASSQAGISVPNQVVDYRTELVRYATLERNRWMLDGTFKLFNANLTANGEEVGGISEGMSDVDGNLSPAVWFDIAFTNVSVLQLSEVWFSTDSDDGVAVDFTADFYRDSTLIHTETVTGNADAEVMVSGFTAYNPNKIRVTITKWSLPLRRVRIAEAYPGGFVLWDGGDVADLRIDMQSDTSCVSLPYSTCALSLDNSDRRFEPRNKEGIFQSLQDRQPVNVEIGVMVDGEMQFHSVGQYFQYNAGWKTSDNGLTIKWDLVDIIGLLSEREYVPPSTLPTNLTGWIQSIVAQLGVSFVTKYTIDSSVASRSLTATVEDVTGIKCGDMIRYLCMATGTWPRMDQETGHLAIEPLWNQGNRIDLDNMESYPVIQANEDVAQVVFTLNDGSQSQYAVGGTDMASSKSVSVTNPFIKNSTQAATAARNIILAYGGNVYSITGRGDPTNEVGDVMTLELDERTATSARLVEQSFSYSKQVLSGCSMKLVQAAGALMYSNRVEITTNRTWTVPTGVTAITIVLVGGGNGGGPGERGSWEDVGANGEDGLGGLVYKTTLNVTAGTSYAVTVGTGGAANGGTGTASTFGSYTSANGALYVPSYTDISSGKAYGRTGAYDPPAHTGDGGQGGAGGTKGERHEVRTKHKDDNGFVWYSTRNVVDVPRGDGQDGFAGSAGAVIIYYDK